MYPASTVEAAILLGSRGASASEISAMLGVSRKTVSDWLAGTIPHGAQPDACPACDTKHRFSELTSDYVYVLGLYLGDGYICRAPRDVFKLRVALDRKYPELIDSAAASISRVRGKPVGRQSRPRNCIELYSYWRAWPCLLPQHGPGKKHDREIALTDWQERLVRQWPHALLRGLIQSDGCRFQNRGRAWSWPRYSFTNRSSDIRSIFCAVCDIMNIHWTVSGDLKVYISRKDDVATLDRFIGPKR